ncbi:hypothetical protein RM530_05760 [Algiphilus sp. W345]|uniref:Uncharacterized protein n=1 Tax=Banduia mediterranea TaxID=3075609 RepID=A0ABU2WI06_9GAMM|nr:hypothetical protein [Algiphilus sp. W345]MDT0496869.1 hypothetical protein [Algiphilus sp. W345]
MGVRRETGKDRKDRKGDRFIFWTNEALLLDLIETGIARYKDDSHLWLFRHYHGREDNQLCAAAAIQDALVIKTVMHRFQAE